MTGIHVRCILDLAWADGETMYDDRYEVSGLAHREPCGYGWADSFCFSITDVLISAPDGDVATSRAVPECLPSSWYDEAESALAEQAREDYDNREDDRPDPYTLEDY